MIAAIGVLLVFGGVSAFLLGAVRYFFPSTDRFFPNDMKRFFAMRTGVYIFLAGVVLLRFFV